MMARCLFSLFLLVLSAQAAIRPHPRIKLTPARVAELQALYALPANDPARLAANVADVKTSADGWLSVNTVGVRITNAVAGNPTVFETDWDLPTWSGTTGVAIAGGTGAWAGATSATGYQGTLATRVDSRHFSVNINTTGYGAIQGQMGVLFFESAFAGYLNYTWEPSAWSTTQNGAGRVLPLTYVMTGQQTYCDKTLEIMDWVNELTTRGLIMHFTSGYAGTSGGLPMKYIPEVFSLGYSTCHAFMSQARKDASVVTANAMFDGWKNSGYAWRVDDNFVAFWATLNLLGYATHGDNARADEIITWVNSRHDPLWQLAMSEPQVHRYEDVQEGVEAPYAKVGEFSGGHWAEGWPYSLDTVHLVIGMWEARRNASDDPADDLISGINSYPRRFMRRIIHELRPDFMRLRMGGENFGQGSATMRLKPFAIIANLIPSTDEGKWAQYVTDNLNVMDNGIQGLPTTEALLFLRHTGTGENWYTLPKTHYSKGDDALFWRSAWGATGEHVEIDGMQQNYVSHGGWHSGNFEIQRGADLLLINWSEWWVNPPGGWAAYPGLYGGTPQDRGGAYRWRGSGMEAEAVSGLYLDDGGVYIGQQQPTSGARGEIDHKIGANDGWVWTSSNLTSVWDQWNVDSNSETRHPGSKAGLRTLRYWLRDRMILPKPTAATRRLYLVRDSVKFRSAAYTKRMLWHVAGPSATWTQGTQTLNQTFGSSEIFVQILNFAATGNLVTNSINGVPATSTLEMPITSAEEDSWGVITTGAEGVTPPTAAMLGTIDANHVGVLIAETEPIIVVGSKTFARSGVIPTYYEYRKWTAASFTADVTGTTHVFVANMKPARAYDVTVGGVPVPGSPFTVTKEGLLYFTFTGAGSSAAVIADAGASGAVAITTAGKLPDGTVGQAYSQTLAASGGTGPYTWRIFSHRTPKWLTLGTDGALTGTPTGAGNYYFSARVEDAAGQVAVKRFWGFVAPAAGNYLKVVPGGSTLSLTWATGQPAPSTTLAVTRGAGGYTSRTQEAEMPAWCSIDPINSFSSPWNPTLAMNTAGLEVGTHFCPIRIEDMQYLNTPGWGAVLWDVEITDAAPDPVTIITTSLPGGTEGVPYSQQLAATGGTPPYAWAVSAGTLPDGLSLVGDTIQGTPTTAGTSNFTVEATDAEDASDTQALSIEISAGADPPIITTSSLPNGLTGTPYSQQLAATGGTAPYTWVLAAGSGPLPNGLQLSTAGAITGTPTVVGPFTFTVQLTDAAAGVDTQEFTITVTQGGATISGAYLR